MTDWAAYFTRHQRHLVEPRRCSIVEAPGGDRLCAALYDEEAFGSFEEFEAWLVWTADLAPSPFTDSPDVRDWTAPRTLKLPHQPPSPGPQVRRTLHALCTDPRLAWLLPLPVVTGRIHDPRNVDAQVLGGWLTVFELDDEDDEDMLSWHRVEHPDRHWRDHLLTDLALGLKVDLEGLGQFDSAHGPRGSRIWFKASPVLQQALDYDEPAPPSPFATTLVATLREGVAVHLSRIGLLLSTPVVDSRGATQRTAHVVSFRADTELTLDLDERIETRTMPPPRR